MLYDYAMKRIFITGAAGFVGFHLALRLKERGDKVIGFDNFNDYYDPALKLARAKELEKAGIRVTEGDLSNESLLKRCVDEHETTHVVHLAAQAGVRYSIKNPHAYVKSNLEGFVNILEVCRHRSSIPLIYASSSSVYGLNEKTPFSEKDAVDHPVSLYGATKRCNEILAYSYHHLYGIPATALRFFTVYGPWGRPDMAYFSFTKAIIEGDPIEVFNEGKLKRDFTYIDDIVDGIIAAIDLGAPYEIFNLGNHRPVELMTFIETIEKAVGHKAKKIFKPMQAGDVLATYADITHSQKMLNFSPKTALEVGIPRFVEWYKNYYTTH